MKRNKTLRANQQRAITALMTQPTIEKAARAAGVSKATMFRWLAEDEFSGALREASGRLLEGAVATLQAGSGEAVEALRGILADKMASDAAKVSAARTILEMALRVRELFEHEQRIAELEAKINVLNPTQKLKAVK
jgi:AcrR family transcriptional regulator